MSETRIPPRLVHAIRWLAKPLRIGFVAVVAAAGCWLGLYAGASAYQPVGPVETTMRLVPALHGETSVMVPPLGRLELNTHDAPLRLDVTVDRIDQQDAQRIFSNPDVLSELQQEVTADLRNGLTQTLVRGLVGGVLGAMLATAVVLRRVRPMLLAGGGTAAVLLVTYGVSGLTFDPRAITEPKYEGLLAGAPSLIGDAQDIAENFDAYSGELARLVTNVTQLYDVTSTLPSYQAGDDTVRMLHVSDIHLGQHAWSIIASVVKQYDIDVVVDSGDISDHGSAPENEFLAPIEDLGVPYVFVRGNHDSTETEDALREMDNVTVLDGSVETVQGIRFLGAGDPRFTPDRSGRDEPAELEAVAQQARSLVEVAKSESAPVDVMVYHDTVGAAYFDGHASLILTGHYHNRNTLLLPKGSRLMQEGSTGGGGLRALQTSDGKAAPLEMSVLYVGKYTKQLEAWDEFTLGGLGLSSVQLERYQVDPDEEAGSPEDMAGGPTPTEPAPSAPLPSPTITDWPEKSKNPLPSPPSGSPSPSDELPSLPPPPTPENQRSGQ